MYEKEKQAIENAVAACGEALNERGSRLRERVVTDLQELCLCVAAADGKVTRMETEWFDGCFDAVFSWEQLNDRMRQLDRSSLQPSALLRQVAEGERRRLAAGQPGGQTEMLMTACRLLGTKMARCDLWNRRPRQKALEELLSLAQAHAARELQGVSGPAAAPAAVPTAPTRSREPERGFVYTGLEKHTSAKAPEKTGVTAPAKKR